jgi:LysR family transcriptional regulator (chromosome initiation inhibitor)
MELNQLRTLVAVVEVGTFEAAAAALHITPSAVSQRIKALEATAGVVLVQRTKPVRPTEQGEVLLRSARQLALLVDEAMAGLGTAAPDSAEGGPGRARVRIPVVVNADSLATWFPPAIAEIGRDPGVALSLRRDDETVTADLLRSGEVMAAVTSDPTPVQGCSVRRLGTKRYRAKAARRYVRRWFPDGPSPSALALAPVLQYDTKDQHQNRLLSRQSPGATPPAHFIPDSVQFVAGVRAGIGWGMVPDLQDPRDTLVTLDPDWSVPVALYWQAWKLTSPTLDRVTAAVVRAAGEHLR